MHLFFDCTFTMVPHGFMQLLIIMAFDPSTNLYVPIWYILLQSKKELTYWHAINNAIVFSDWKMEALSCTSDFERGLINTIIKQFQDSEGNSNFHGCFFHWKKDITKHLKTLRLDEKFIFKLVGNEGLIDLLTHILIEEIVSKGTYLKKFR